MYEFKKTDSKELERTIAVLIATLMIIMPIIYLLEFVDVLHKGRASLCGTILFVGSLNLLMFDIFFVFQKKNRGIRVSDVIFISVFLALVVSTIFAQNVAVALSGQDLTEESFFTYLAYIIIGFSASLIADKNNRKIIYGAGVVFGLIQVIVGIFQSVIPIFDIEILEQTRYRAFGTMGNANPYGTIMVLMTGLECGLFFESVNKKQRVFHGILIVAYMYALLLSGTRGAVAGFFVAALAFAIYLVVKEKKQKGNISKLLKTIGIVIALILLSLVIYFLTSMENWNEVLNRTSYDVKNGGFGGDRLLIWQRTFCECFLKRPLIGVGPSNIWIVHMSGSFFEEGTIVYTTVDAHNKYLNYLCTQGIIGLSTYLALLIYAAKSALHRVNEDYIEVKGYIALLFAFLGFVISDVFCIGMDVMVPYFYILIGMMATRKEAKRIGKKKSEKSSVE